MPRRRKLRSMTDTERTELERLARARSAELRLVERARAILAVYHGQRIKDAAQTAGCAEPTVSNWLTRFEELGLDGLQDAPRSGRPPTYSQQEKGELIALARTHPDALELDFGHWTLDRLTEYVQSNLHIGISRAHIARVLEAEGIRWYQEQVYFSERPDPQFAEKRGPSSHSISSPLPTRM